MRKKIATVALMLMIGGCAASATKKPSPVAVKPPAPLATAESPTAVISSTDPCAMRLHDISGAFMLYIATHRDLPADLYDLKKLADEELTFVCPESHRPYIYAPNGILLPDRMARIILYDAAPSHRGYRQAIAITEPAENQALVTKVVTLPESFFLLHPPQ